MTRQIRLRLIHDGVSPLPPVPETLHFGLQDAKGAVHAGVAHGDARRFDLTLDVAGREGVAALPVFRGMFAHGPPAQRFLYLSWKRDGEHEHPWHCRIKIPLGVLGWHEIGQAEQFGRCLVADVRGRRPHSSQPVQWQVETLGDARDSPA